MCEKNERLLKQQFEQIETTQSEVDYENDKIDFDENGFEATDEYVEISDDELLTNNVVAILEDPISDQFEKLEDHKIESNDPKDEPISEKKSKAVKNNKLINVNEGAKKHNCTQCKRQFKLKTSLDLHVIRNHSGSATLDEAKLICSICNKKCVSETHYNRHMNYHRTGKQYHCDICGRDFSQYRSYESHKYSHTGERPFLCTECGKTFKQNCDLEIHMRLHSNSYPYICNICGAKYRYSSIFTLHKRTHSGEKPFECPFCDKKFRNSCRLKVHKRSIQEKSLMFVKYVKKHLQDHMH
ncbi:gastrula zinc finger protein XlCGF62.1-like [Ctenocephalides felis]|uniref:gastrula zinc finger protein XlCGF62.1-like n=1 Tax=Ctenocephalides felis TaxID=7515 RepID=UPI000E6E2317|nr:gastrula zinc finger protein XlCGF62.1-like [Ctenocephalides felis]